MSPQRAPAVTTMPHVIDPTTNVNALVSALEEKTKELASSETRYQNDMRNLESKYRDSMRDAETRRLDQLAALRQTYDFKIADMLIRSNEKALELLAVNLSSFKTDTAAAIADLQQKSWTTQGEAKRGGDVWSRLTGLVAIAMSAVTLAYLVAKGI